MTFPNRINYRLRSREKSPQTEHKLTARDVETSPVQLMTVSCPASDLVTQVDKFQTSVVHDHALLPLTHKLMALISQPAKLLAALVANCDQRTSKQVFWAKAIAYQHAELQGLCTAWFRIMEDIDQYELSPTDVMVLKAVLYYWRMWQFVCITCIDAVTSIEESAMRRLPRPPPESKTWVSLLQKRRTASISPPLEAKCLDAVSQGMVFSGSGLSKRSRITKKSNEFLVAWFLAHKDNPYPSSDERMEIATRTGLAEQQVRNWFANMRKRHWKPNRANAKKPRCLLDYVLRQSEA